MKTNIEQHIKSQLDERNLNPSESSWEKLSQMMDKEKPQAKTIRFPKWWTFAVAASVVAFVSVLMVNLPQQTEENTIQIADTKKVSPETSTETNKIISEEIRPENIQIHDESNSIQTQIAKSDLKTEKKIESQQNAEIIQAPNTKEKISETNLIGEELKLPEVKKQEQIAVVSDPEPKTKPDKKKSNYVDSDMLLYSVENNQAISESNANTRLVIVDFNK